MEKIKKTPSQLGTSRPVSSFTLISFLSTNARSLFNKVDELQDITYRTKPLLICITESWCSREEPNSLYSMDGYSLIFPERIEHKIGVQEQRWPTQAQLMRSDILRNIDVMSRECLWSLVPLSPKRR